MININNPFTGLFNNMHSEYKIASIMIHASCFGNRMNFGAKYKGIDMCSTTEGHENALFLASASMITLVGYTYDYLGLDSKSHRNILNELGIKYFGFLSRNSWEENK